MKNAFFTLVVAGPGVLAWIVGLTVALQRFRLVWSGLRGIGTVVDSFEGSNTPSRVGGIEFGTKAARFPIIEVRDATTGKPIRFRTTIGTSRTIVTIGEQLPVRYLPGLPDQAEIDRPFALWGLPVLACAIGTVFLSLWWWIPTPAGS